MACNAKLFHSHTLVWALDKIRKICDPLPVLRQAFIISTSRHTCFHAGMTHIRLAPGWWHWPSAHATAGLCYCGMRMHAQHIGIASLAVGPKTPPLVYKSSGQYFKVLRF
jgi:hypothetical protein